MNKIVITLYKISRTLYLAKIPLLPTLIKVFLRLIFGCVIPPSAQIGKGAYLAYGGLGTVLHFDAVIGENCSIQTNVTIGGTPGSDLVPILGNNVLVGTGAKIIGNVKIGNNVIIGANAVVTKDVPDNCTVAGVPAKIIKRLE